MKNAPNQRESNHRAVDCLRRNLAAVCKSLQRDERGLAVLQMDATGAPLGGGSPPDLVFVDPPYEIIAGIAPALFQRLGEIMAPATGALIVFEMPGEMELAPAGWRCRKRLGQGTRQPTAAIFERTGS